LFGCLAYATEEHAVLELRTHLPKDANIYGLGQVIASSGFRRDPE
jgi:alpha-glucosidase